MTLFSSGLNVSAYIVWMWWVVLSPFHTSLQVRTDTTTNFGQKFGAVSVGIKGYKFLVDIPM